MDSNNNTDNNPSFLSRVAQHDSTKKGIAAAAAGVLIAVVCEALWPSNS